MKVLPIFAAVLLGAALCLSRAAAAPVPIIFDTDMDTDCDDAGALAVLHALADRGECGILATVVSTRHPGAAPTVAAINAYYGRTLPIAAVKRGGVNERSAYAGEIAQEFPQPLRSTDDAPDAALLYRDLLEILPDHSVTIVTVGYLTNLRNLLELPAADGHPAGIELARQKVQRFVCMGGNFIGTRPRDDLKLGNVNFQRDAASALHVVKHWPGPIDFVGREIGSVPSGLTAGAVLAQTPANNPVRRAYEHYFGGKLKSRHVADLVTVLYAVRGARDYWTVSPPGRLDLHDDITLDWVSDPAGQHRYLLKKMRDRDVEAVLNELLIQPPKR